MKKKKRNISLKVSVQIIVIGFMSMAWGCGEPDLIPESPSEEKALESSVVQTEWKDERSVDKTAGQKMRLDTLSTSNPLSVEQAGSQSVQDMYVVQIGAFLNKDNAERRVAGLKRKGIPATMIISEKDVKRWHIVRIGAFKNRKDAIDTAGRFSAEEMTDSAVLYNGKVVKLLKSGGRMPPIQASGSGSRQRSSKYDRFTFQAGGLMSQTAAKKQSAKLGKKGYSPFIVKVPDTVNKETWYAIRIGRFYTIDEAAEAAAKFAAKEDIPTKAQRFSK